ncbi:MAG TPA: D-alanyl-D-alanine carboxypeptidase/D-alanyl-D-alanine-endopeptidase, partial [Abditibacteriaceae bacterium]|nr:D-alanyl-D-alanine carboxypeptidase/D-alanyl-D-alanine-endopeptidase [Abditibacteriaceae bacterium]
TLDDSLWYYGAEVSALALERNQVDVTITGTRSGRAAKVEVDPVLPGFTLGTDIIAQVQTGGRSLSRQEESALIQWNRADASNGLGPKLYVRGQVAPRQVITDGLAIPNVARIVALTFAQQLRAQDVAVGASVEIGICPREASKTVAQHDSAPLRVLVSRFLKKSDNLYGEMFLRSVGATVEAEARSGGNTSDESSGAGVASTGTAARAHRSLLAWLKQIDAPTSGLRLSDGSGLSRYNLLTPRAITSLLSATEKLKGSQAFWDALPIAGTDGTLKNRMARTRAAKNVRAKTGTFSIASCLSGYVTTRDGQRLAVSVLTNFARDGAQARELQNDIFAALADASWAPSGS